MGQDPWRDTNKSSCPGRVVLVFRCTRWETLWHLDPRQWPSDSYTITGKDLSEVWFLVAGLRALMALARKTFQRITHTHMFTHGRGPNQHSGQDDVTRIKWMICRILCSRDEGIQPEAEKWSGRFFSLSLLKKLKGTKRIVSFFKRERGTYSRLLCPVFNRVKWGEESNDLILMICGMDSSWMCKSDEIDTSRIGLIDDDVIGH